MEDTPLERTFSFVIQGKLAGSCQPGSHPSSLEEDLENLKGKGVTAIISLNEAGLDEEIVRAHGMQHLSLSVADYCPPTIEQMERMVEFVDANETTLVHCNAGMGRTGTMLAAYLIAKGEPASCAIKQLRSTRRGSIQTTKQEDALRSFELHLRP